MNVLLTGGTGFVGSHMIDYLLANVPNVQIFATRRWRSRDENIKHLFGDYRVKFYEADLLDRSSLRAVIDIAKPELVFHFAAQSFPETSFITPTKTLMTNVIGTSNLFEELRSQTIPDPRIISVSSSEVYGMPKPDEVPIKETNPFRAANPYSISKCGHDLLSSYYFQAYGLKIITTRMFSHEGARRGKQFALSSFAYQIARHEHSNGKSFNPKSYKFDIMVGNLQSVRTYAHIDDAVRAYYLASQRGIPGEMYNIGGDFTCTVGEALENLLSKSTMSRDLFDVKIDNARIRPTDITLQIPDCTKFKNQTGWKPTKGIDDITQDLLDYWRSQIKLYEGIYNV